LMTEPPPENPRNDRSVEYRGETGETRKKLDIKQSARGWNLTEGKA